MPYQKLEFLITRLRDTPADPTLHHACVERFDQLHESNPACFEVYEPLFVSLLEFLFKEDVVKHQYLGLLVTKQLRLKYRLDDVVEPASAKATYGSLARDSLFLAVLEKTYNADWEFEQFITGLRRFLLFDYLQKQRLDEEMLRLAIAIAHQSFNNEHIFDEQEDERDAVAQISAKLEKEFTATAGIPGEMELMVMGMYLPLAMHSLGKRIAEMQLSHYSEPARHAIVRMIKEPFAELKLRDTIPSFGEIANKASLIVRDQYEENPFPRWFNPGAAFPCLETRLGCFKPDFSWPVSLRQGGLSILVAGCGTGQQSLGIARANPKADVVAFDLSRSSLAYAARMSERYDVRNIRYLHGDILNLPELHSRFHHVECVGVLHCLQDSRQGWRAIEKVLLPGGTFHVGVYSKLARLQITRMWQQIDNMRLKPVAEDMKLFRRAILNDQQYKSEKKLLLHRDFFTMSMFRDLLFHTHEHHYVLSEIEQVIAELNLSFLGFNLSRGLEEKYRTAFPDDSRLSNFGYWKQFEKHYIGTLEMYRFWLQKPL